jgi:hypothetical protein
MNTIFVTSVSTSDLPAVRLMDDSLRSFGGELAEAPVWVFLSEPSVAPDFKHTNTHILPFKAPDLKTGCLFGNKVAVCARAEELAPAGTSSLVWIDPFCIFVQPPVLFELDADFDAAFRPVHISNVGLPPTEPLDAFWRGIYTAVGLEDDCSTVTSFVDGQLLRTYLNSHAFAISPALGLMRRWVDLFQRLVRDAEFQSVACADENHQIFLFQALLSTLVASSIEPGRLRILPPSYNYPYHLQDRIPPNRRFKTLNETVLFTYEDSPIHPEAIFGMDINEPLRGWLMEHAPK